MKSTIAIKDISVYHPRNKINNSFIESKVNANQKYLGDGVLKKLFGINNRRFAEKDEQG